MLPRPPHLNAVYVANGNPESFGDVRLNGSIAQKPLDLHDPFGGQKVSNFSPVWHASNISPLASGKATNRGAGDAKPDRNFFVGLFGLLDKTPNFGDVFIRNLRRPTPIPKRHKSGSACMTKVSSVRRPLKIGERVIRFYAVLMIHLGKILGVRDEQFGEDAVNKMRPKSFGVRKGGHPIANSSDTGFKEPPLPAATTRAHFPSLSNFVTGTVGNGVPHSCYYNDVITNLCASTHIHNLTAASWGP